MIWCFLFQIPIFFLKGNSVAVCIFLLVFSSLLSSRNVFDKEAPREDVTNPFNLVLQVLIYIYLYSEFYSLTLLLSQPQK